ncbi:hypothetical protein ABVK25_011035 [Lepraria finkii]|uniref:Uncharacterized protein n=1 Tax=Lepraria finkii TaxID=1340010 RepID=A0ABR4ASP9_9LECA
MSFQHSSQNSGLEVDLGQAGLQHSQDVHSSLQAYNAPQLELHEKHRSYAAPPLAILASKPRRTVLFLSSALALSFILSIIAAAVGGSLAAHRQHELNEALTSYQHGTPSAPQGATFGNQTSSTQSSCPTPGRRDISSLLALSRSVNDVRRLGLPGR